MNKYILYCQDTRKNFAVFNAVCKDVFEIKNSDKIINILYDELEFLKNSFMKFAIIDPNGAVISSDLRLYKIERKQRSLTISVYSAGSAT